MATPRTQLLTARDGTRLFVRTSGDSSAARNLLLVHGYGEHGGRYDTVADQLVAAGYRVIIPDVRGHGQSEGRRGHVMSFSEYLDDLDTVIEKLGVLDRPAAALGHSHGGLILSSWLLERQQPFFAVGLSSPFLGLAIKPPLWKLKAGLWLSKVGPKISLPTEIKPEWVCRDPEVVRLYASDPLNHSVVNSRWFTEATAAMASCHSRAHSISKPMLVMQAGDDKLVERRDSARFAAAAHAEYVEIAQAYHEILFEAEGRERTARFVDFFSKHGPA